MHMDHSRFERRSRPRYDIQMNAEVCGVEWRPFKAHAANVSQVGFLLSSAGKFLVGEPISLALPGIGIRSARVVRSRFWRRYGCTFDQALTDDELHELLGASTSTWIRVGRPGKEAVLGD